MQVVAFIKGTRTQPECGFSYKVLTMLNQARVNYEVVNVLDEQFNPGLREAIKTYSQWPTIPQVSPVGNAGCTYLVLPVVSSARLSLVLLKCYVPWFAIPGSSELSGHTVG